MRREESTINFMIEQIIVSIKPGIKTCHVRFE